MTGFRPRLIEARTAVERMSALCEFIEFWLGPRREEYGEPAERLDAIRLPEPLRTLYRFAGRWPSGLEATSESATVPLFAVRNRLLALDEIEADDEGRIVFMFQTMGWVDLMTLPDGADPPVWQRLDGDVRVWSKSLSESLVNCMLDELFNGSRRVLQDDGLRDRLAVERDAARPVWFHRLGSLPDQGAYFLWGDVLVADPWGDRPEFAANRPEAIDFLEANQGQIDALRFERGGWIVLVEEDGSSSICRWDAHSTKVDEMELPPGSVDFPALLVEVASGEPVRGSYGEAPTSVSILRRGQELGSYCRVSDPDAVAALVMERLAPGIDGRSEAWARFVRDWGSKSQ